MKMKKFGLFCCGLLLFVGIARFLFSSPAPEVSGAPPYGEALEDVPVSDEWSWLKEWKRPDGPVRVGLQVGHWKNNELPEELDKLIGNTGASGGGKTEWEINLLIANEVAKILEQKSIAVDIIPATVPPDYWADAFIAIHADGSTSLKASGFKVAGPWRDRTGDAEHLVSAIEKTYQKATGMSIDPNVSRNMRGYYAFAWWRYEHSIHPMTTAVIFESGFLSNPSDRKILTQRTDDVANGLSQGILEYLAFKGLVASEKPEDV